MEGPGVTQVKSCQGISSPTCKFCFSELPTVTGENKVLFFSPRCRHWRAGAAQVGIEKRASIPGWFVGCAPRALSLKWKSDPRIL